jgi:vitamin B12 transporter
LNDDVSVEARSTWSRGRTEFDGFPPPAFTFSDTPEYGTTNDWVSYAGVKIDSFSDRLQHRIGVAYTDTDREDIDPTSSVRTTLDSRGRNLRYEYQGTLTLNERVSGVFGVERERSALRTASPSEFDPNPKPLDRDVVMDSIYAQVQVTPIRALTLSGGLRHDDHETFGNDRSAQLAAAWSVSSSTLLRASYGEGFKAPTLYQLYSDYGTATLMPEESSDWDAGIEQHLFGDRLVLSATYFERKIDDMIDFVSCFEVATPRCATQQFGYYENLAQTRADGYEIGLAARLGSRLTFDANYTSLDARNDSRSSANFGNELARRPRDTAFAALSYEWPIRLTTTLAAQYVGRAFDDAANTAVLHSYTLVDLRAAYRVSDSIEIYGRIENALDEDYESVRGYGTLGRGAYLGVRVTH